MPEGRESPPPERQTGAQQHDVPGSGKGVDNTEGKGETNKSELDDLTSNPKGPMEASLADKFSKGSSEAKSSKQS